MSSSSQSSGGKCRQISLDEIKEATNNFAESNVVGHGGEGKVYLAQIKLGWKLTQVAVKHLKPNSQEFDKEIKTISKFQHPNLVSLLGYCNESGQKILLYEFMEKGSLADYVTEKSEISLSWLQRIRICLDAARGLQHLHIETDENPKGIIHRDVKPGNILLGKDWVAKISDFGMVKLSDADQVKSTMVTGLKGTGGYYAPEYVRYQSVTRKIDVYAFGVVLFQVLCQKMPWDRGDESYYGMEEEDLGIWAHQNVDPIIKPNVSDDSLKEFTAIVGKSLKYDPRKRPTMDGVVLGLEKVLKLLEWEYEAKKGQAAKVSTEHSTAGSHLGSSSVVSETIAERESNQTIVHGIRRGITKMFKFLVGDNEKIFRQTFETVPEEQLQNSYDCYLSISAGPVMGILYLSSAKLAFCSYYPLSYIVNDTIEWSQYKVVIPLHQLKAANPSSSRGNSAGKYIQIISVDNNEFWYFGFLNYDSAVKCLQKALEARRLIG